MKQQFSKSIAAAMVAAALFLSSSAVFAQNQGVKIGTNPTTKDANSNLEVEPTTTGRTFRLNSTTGQMTHKDGTEGAGRVLTSDANGNASWKGSQAFIFYANSTPQAPGVFVVPSGLAQTSLGQRVPFTPDFGTGYNATTKTFSFPMDGWYRVSGGIRCKGTTAAAQNLNIAINDGLHYVPSDNMLISSTNDLHQSFSVIGKYTAGAEVSLYINNFTGSNVSCFTGYLAVEQIIPTP